MRHPGKVTLPDYMSQPEVECIGQAGHHDDDREFPWWSPGRFVVIGLFKSFITCKQFLLVKLVCSLESKYTINSS